MCSSDLYKAFQTTIFRRALNTRIAGINALGEWHARRLRQQLQLGQEYPILVVPDGADLSDAPIDRGEARLRLGLAQDDVLFLAFGNFRRDKDYPTLFSALAGVKSTRIKLMLVGHLAEYSQEELDGLIDAADVRQKIAVMHTQFASPQQVREFFSACDVLILPYGRLYTDGSGPLRKEAATYARAVLASEIGRAHV